MDLHYILFEKNKYLQPLGIYGSGENRVWDAGRNRLKIPSGYLLGMTRKTLEKSQSEYLAAGIKLELLE